MAARKSYYIPGDIVSLYGHADGENGPHWTDLCQPPRFAKIVGIELHRYNDSWVLGYSVHEFYPGMTSEGYDQSCIVTKIKPGEISRLASGADIAKFNLR